MLTKYSKSGAMLPAIKTVSESLFMKNSGMGEQRLDEKK
jgi:hypothetical protein